MNIITAIAKEAGRDYITPEDVQRAHNEHRDDPHLVRIDLLEILGRQTEFGAEDFALCAFVGFSGPEPIVKKAARKRT